MNLSSNNVIGIDMRWIVTGPESCGKTSLSEFLTSELGLILIPEYARIYITGLDRPYVKEDLDRIARQQIIEWNQYSDETIVFDTDILTTIIWYEEKYGAIPPYMMEHWLSQEKSIYLLCKPDIFWQPDPLRENPDDQDRLFEIYFHYLNAYGKPFKVVSGAGEARNVAAKEFLSRLIRDWQ
ncbi:MAG: ATP-binding protein [Saprospiraceae bacterium]|nr:ATP-binding protein [Saprospiraceae bacterium]